MNLRFAAHVMDLGLPEGNYAQTALADLDGDGRLEYILGRQYAEIYWYSYDGEGVWSRHLLGLDSPSDVGGCVLDVDRDGFPDFVTGGAWYRNSRCPDKTFERFAFDVDLTGVHDVCSADVDGDGHLEVITMSDQNSLRWYKIPEDPTQPWPCCEIGPAVHAGVSVGDINGNGHLDVVRTNVWFENAAGDGTRWVEHPIGPNTPPPPDFQPYFAFDATYSVVSDMNGNGYHDIVFTDAEIPGGKIWWMENLDGTGLRWERHEIYNRSDDARRGAYHSLYVGDLDGDDDLDVFSCEMEAVGGDAPPRWYIWENVDGRGQEWREHVILDANLGGHAAVVGDVTGNGLPDIIAKPWRAAPSNALGGSMFVVFLENVSRP
ncbi:MAG: VCBS repeat-containing protein [Chloroflexi bacterium]|nr:VCBS repeat-containing protein [Chloroflexota bacterium]